MNPFSKEELENIEKMAELNAKMEDYFKEKREMWNNKLDELIKSFNGSDLSASSVRKMIDSQGMILTYKQILSEEISLFLTRRSKEEVKLKALKQQKFLFYATGFGLKTNNGEKSLLIDAHTSELERNIQLIETHIEFLRASSKNCESYQYVLKNVIELMNYLK